VSVNKVLFLKLVYLTRKYNSRTWREVELINSTRQDLFSSFSIIYRLFSQLKLPAIGLGVFVLIKTVNRHLFHAREKISNTLQTTEKINFNIKFEKHTPTHFVLETLTKVRQYCKYS
jgi:hypothetical protein